MKRGDVDIYIYHYYRYNCFQIEREKKSAGNLLCLNGSHAETSHPVVKKNTMALVSAFLFCHNIMSSCSHEKTECHNE